MYIGWLSTCPCTAGILFSGEARKLAIGIFLDLCRGLWSIKVNCRNKCAWPSLRTTISKFYVSMIYGSFLCNIAYVMK